MKRYTWMFALLAALAWGGCADSHPEEAEVKAKVVGAYCSPNARYKMEILDAGRYEARRSNRSAFATGMISEKCEGAYQLVYDEEKKTWSLVLGKSDKNSNPFVKCPGHSIVLWEKEKGYLISDSAKTLTEPFDQTEVTNDCGTGL